MIVTAEPNRSRMSRLTITEYATLSVQLAVVSASAGPLNATEELLRRANLSEEEWECEVAYWEAELSQALDFDDQLPDLLVTYSQAVQAAQQRLSSGPVPLTAFASVLAEVRQGVQLDQVLRRHHIGLPDFLAAQRWWLDRAIADPEIRHVLEAALR
jgi:hypothetical protein